MPELDGVSADSPQPDGLTPSSGIEEPGLPASQPGSALPTPAGTTPGGEPEYKAHTAQRIQELLRDRDEANRRADQALALARQVSQPAVPPAHDPLTGLVNHPDPATAQFWQQVKTVAETIADQRTAQRVQPLEQAYTLGRQQLAQVTLGQFYRENPEVTPNSPEAMAIAERIQQGYPLEEAKRIVLYDKLQAQLVHQQTTGQQRTAALKRQASPESTPGIPATAGLPRAKSAFRETLMQELQAEGL